MHAATSISCDQIFLRAICDIKIDFHYLVDDESEFVKCVDRYLQLRTFFTADVFGDCEQVMVSKLDAHQADRVRNMDNRFVDIGLQMNNSALAMKRLLFRFLRFCACSIASCGSPLIGREKIYEK